MSGTPQAPGDETDRTGTLKRLVDELTVYFLEPECWLESDAPVPETLRALWPGEFYTVRGPTALVPQSDGRSPMLDQQRNDALLRLATSLLSRNTEAHARAALQTAPEAGLYGSVRDVGTTPDFLSRVPKLEFPEPPTAPEQVLGQPGREAEERWSVMLGDKRHAKAYMKNMACAMWVLMTSWARQELNLWFMAVACQPGPTAESRPWLSAVDEMYRRVPESERSALCAMLGGMRILDVQRVLLAPSETEKLEIDNDTLRKLALLLDLWRLPLSRLD